MSKLNTEMNKATLSKVKTTLVKLIVLSYIGLICLTLSSTPLMANVNHPLKIATIKVLAYNDMWKIFENKSIEILCFSNDLCIFSYSFWGSETTFIPIQADARKAIVEAVTKFEKWNTKAMSKNITLEKLLKRILVGKMGWQDFNGFHKSAIDMNIDLVFKSLKMNHHVVSISVPQEITDQNNNYLTHQPPNFYFNYSEALKLKKILTEEFIKSQLSEISKTQKKIDSEFN